MNQQIYVVCQQGDVLSEKPQQPVAAYQDYPTALAFAETIFVPVFGYPVSAKDLIYILTLTPTATVAPTPTVTA